MYRQDKRINGNSHGKSFCHAIVNPLDKVLIIPDEHIEYIDLEDYDYDHDHDKRHLENDTQEVTKEEESKDIDINIDDYVKITNVTT